MIAPEIGKEYLNNDNAPNFYFYFILNKYINDDSNDDINKAKTFTLHKTSQTQTIGDKTLTAYTYTLDEGEYFLYTDANKL